MKTRLHQIGIVFLVILFYAAGWISVDKTQRLATVFVITLMLLFIFSFYYRLYVFSKIERLQKKHQKETFLEYFNSRNLTQLVWHFVTPYPILKALKTKEEEVLRKQLNIWTLLGWFFFVLLLLIDLLTNR